MSSTISIETFRAAHSDYPKRDTALYQAISEQLAAENKALKEKIKQIEDEADTIRTHIFELQALADMIDETRINIDYRNQEPSIDRNLSIAILALKQLAVMLEKETGIA